MTMNKDQRIADASEEVRLIHGTELEGPVAPARVLIAPWGEVESANGSFVVDDESAALAVTAFEKHSTDLPIDYEHQTLGGVYASPSGQAPAAGWIKRLIAEPGVGVFADIEWTPQATRMLAAKEYRYLSPVVIVRKRDRKLTSIHSVALTNKPAIVGMNPIVNRADGIRRRDGDPQVADDGRPGTASVPAGHVPCSDSDAIARLCHVLDLPASVELYDVLVAAGEQLVELKRQTGEERVKQRVVEAMKAGKLVEAQRGWAEALIGSDEALFDQWLATAPVVLRPGRIAPPGEASAHSNRAFGVAVRARAEFRAAPALATITSEEAFVADALRAAGVQDKTED
jgi:phage I-like protein